MGRGNYRSGMRMVRRDALRKRKKPRGQCRPCFEAGLSWAMSRTACEVCQRQ